MSIGHQDVVKQLIREYQSLNGIDVQVFNTPPTPLEFARIVKANRPVVFNSTNNI